MKIAIVAIVVGIIIAIIGGFITREAKDPPTANLGILTAGVGLVVTVAATVIALL